MQWVGGITPVVDAVDDGDDGDSGGRRGRKQLCQPQLHDKTAIEAYS